MRDWGSERLGVTDEERGRKAERERETSCAQKADWSGETSEGQYMWRSSTRSASAVMLKGALSSQYSGQLPVCVRARAHGCARTHVCVFEGVCMFERASVCPFSSEGMDRAMAQRGRCRAMRERNADGEARARRIGAQTDR